MLPDELAKNNRTSGDGKSRGLGWRSRELGTLWVVKRWQRGTIAGVRAIGGDKE